MTPRKTGRDDRNMEVVLVQTFRFQEKALFVMFSLFYFMKLSRRYTIYNKIQRVFLLLHPLIH